MANIITRACLGRAFQPGMLYDFHKDKLLPGNYKTLWDIESGKEVYSSSLQNLRQQLPLVSSDDSFEWKCDQLGVVDLNTKLSLLSGVIDFQGAAKLLCDRKMSKRHARVILACKSTSKMEEIVLPSQQAKADAFKSATHVVTKVLYGIEMFFVFDQEVGENEDVNDVQACLEEKVRAIYDGGNLEPMKSTKLVTFKYYGDLLDEPVSYEDIARLCSDDFRVPENLNVPMKVWLHPLGNKSSVQVEISHLLYELLDEKLLRPLWEFELLCTGLMNKDTCRYFMSIEKNLEHMKRLIKDHRIELQKSLNNLLLQVRSGSADESELANIAEENQASPFNCKQLYSWFNDKDKEVKLLDDLLKSLKQQQEHIQLAFTGINDYVTDPEVENVLCFDFNIVEEDSCILQKMEDYNNGRKVSQEVASPAHNWHKNEHVMQEMREQVRRFKVFVKNNIKKRGIKFVVANGESDRSINKVGVILLFVRGRLTMFEPPDQPGKPSVSKQSNNSLCLSWDVPKYGAESVESYTISYRSENDMHDQWCSETSLNAQVDLDHLLPDTVYYFRVRAEASAGASSESIISTIKMLPEQPGQPLVAMPCNSVLLKWKKPAAQGTADFLSCTVSYRSSHEEPDKWHTQPVFIFAQRNALSDVAPMTTYCLKVTAETIDELSLKSDIISDSIKTTCMPSVSQPGKPYSSWTTQNSLKLNWSKPLVQKLCKAKSDYIQYYVIDYKSVDGSQEGWHSKKTSFEYIIVGDLKPRTSYRFKVKAVTASGAGPDSDLSDPIETKLSISQPGKPHTVHITHTSIKLKWDCPQVGATNVQSYTIFYRSESLPQEWYSQQTPTCQKYFAVVNLTPETAYQFKVRAETATGSGPLSISSDYIKTLLPPPGSGPLSISSDYIKTLLPPGKPHAKKVTHNSVLLEWLNPITQKILPCAIKILYQSSHEPADKWHTQGVPSPQQNTLLSYEPKHYTQQTCKVKNLDSNTKYYFKIRVETTTESGLESELSDPIMTTVTLGKLQVLDVSHDRIELCWEKPDCGPPYSVYFQLKNDPMDIWHSLSPPTESESCVIKNLIPDTKYCVKVKAETGYHPESISGTILTKIPPLRELRASFESNNEIMVCWKRPDCDKKHSLPTCVYLSQTDLEWPGQPFFTTSESIILTLPNPDKPYYVKAKVETKNGNYSESICGPIQLIDHSIVSSK